MCVDLKWKEHLLGSDQSLAKKLTRRVNGLLMVATRAPFSTRLSVANGIFISKLCYLIQLWGGQRSTSYMHCRSADHPKQGSQARMSCKLLRGESDLGNSLISRVGLAGTASAADIQCCQFHNDCQIIQRGYMPELFWQITPYLPELS